MSKTPSGGYENDYSSYLKIDDLLALQQLLTEGAEDEMAFIVVHQVYELWFKLILHELDGAVANLLDAEPWRAARRLTRAVVIEKILIDQLEVLETMSPESFYVFRDPLAPASGFQSVQFREIEAVSGGLSASPGAVSSYRAEGREKIEKRLASPTLWDATVVTLTRFTLVEADPGTEEVIAAVAGIYADHEGAARAWLHQLFECLVDHDEAVATWRYRHMLMAAREIGRRPGTGGSLGVEYLQRTLDKRFFPILWDVRSRI